MTAPAPVVVASALPFHYGTNGAVRGARGVAHALAARGHPVTWLTPAREAPGCPPLARALEALAAEGVAVARHPGGEVRARLPGSAPDAPAPQGPVDLRVVPDPAAALAAPGGPGLVARSAPASAVVVSCEDPGWRLLEVALARGGPTVALVQTLQLLPGGSEAFFPDPAGRALLARCATGGPRGGGVLAIGAFAAAALGRWLGIEARTCPVPAYGAGPWPALGRPDAPWVTLVNPCQAKGLSLLLALARARPDLRFAAVATWGARPDDLRALEAHGNVEVVVADPLAPAPGLAGVLARTRVLLAPSLWAETFGHVVVEALLHGVPVLAADHAGLRDAALGAARLLPIRPVEAWTSGPDGAPAPVVPPQDPGPWLAALAALDDPTAWEAASSAGRAAALRHVAGLDLAPLRAALAPPRPAPAEVRA